MKTKLNCILLVDDDSACNFLSNVILEELNCTNHVKTTTDGEEALHYLEDCIHQRDATQEHPTPELIFLDINMPRMNGWQFVNAMRKLREKKLKSPVIVMLSSSVSPEEIHRAKKTPEIAEYCEKPISCEMIDSIFNKYFPEYH